MDRNSAGEHGDPEWASLFQPWSLLFNALLLATRQSFVLMWVFIELSAFSRLLDSGSFSLVKHCRYSEMGVWVYPCEATKATAQSFPLVAASASLILTLRYMLQLRMYYHAFVQKRLVNFNNSIPFHDLSVQLLTVSFVFGMCHFVLDFFFPPYAASTELVRLLSVYLVPCILFYFLVLNILDIHWHFTPLATIMADGHKGSEIVRGLEVIQERYMRAAIKKVIELYEDCDVLELESVVQDTVDHAQRLQVLGNQGVEHSSFGFYSGALLSGLWPGTILLDTRLHDESSRSFRKAVRTFFFIFCACHFLILGFFCHAAASSFSDAFFAREAPSGSPVLQNQTYVDMGLGYCRDEGGNRPDGFYKVMSMGKHQSRGVKSFVVKLTHKTHRTPSLDMKKLDMKVDYRYPKKAGEVWRLAAMHCNDLGDSCIGFSTVDAQASEAFVTLYSGGMQFTPLGLAGLALQWI